MKFLQLIKPVRKSRPGCRHLTNESFFGLFWILDFGFVLLCFVLFWTTQSFQFNQKEVLSAREHKQLRALGILCVISISSFFTLFLFQFYFRQCLQCSLEFWAE